MIGKPYERVAESGRPNVKQRLIADEIDRENEWVEETLLADGRLRVDVLDRTGIIERIVYIAATGTCHNEFAGSRA
jgi:hypothetical protein